MAEATKEVKNEAQIKEAVRQDVQNRVFKAHEEAVAADKKKTAVAPAK